MTAQRPDKEDVRRALAALARGVGGPDLVQLRAQIRLLLDAPDQTGLSDELRAEMRAALEVSQRAPPRAPVVEPAFSPSAKPSPLPPASEHRPPPPPAAPDEAKRLRAVLSDIAQHAATRGGIWARNAAKEALERDT